MSLGLDDLTHYLLSEFESTMMILISQPGNMTEYLRPLCDKLQQVNSEDILHAVIDILYNQVFIFFLIFLPKNANLLLDHSIVNSDFESQ